MGAARRAPACTAHAPGPWPLRGPRLAAPHAATLHASHPPSPAPTFHSGKSLSLASLLSLRAWYEGRLSRHSTKPARRTPAGVGRRGAAVPVGQAAGRRCVGPWGLHAPCELAVAEVQPYLQQASLALQVRPHLSSSPGSRACDVHAYHRRPPLPGARGPACRPGPTAHLPSPCPPAVPWPRHSRCCGSGQVRGPAGAVVVSGARAGSR